MIGDVIYAGTPIDWLPESVVNAWRFLFFVCNLYVLVKFATMTWSRHGVREPIRQQFASAANFWIWLGVTLFLLRGELIQIERFGDKAVYEGLPLQTIILFCIWRGVVNYDRRR
jgi:hypothetical protein